jgi:hypothetical protein
MPRGVQRAMTIGDAPRRTPMLAEKFFLLLETLRSHAGQDGSPRVVSASPHVPIKLPVSR